MNAANDVGGRLAQLALVDVKTLSKLLGVSERQCWRLTAMAEAGRSDFPRPLRLGTRTVRWRLGDVERYLAALAEGGRP
jgi:predicted DNA-binding transcriptional regulator AlpA